METPTQEPTAAEIEKAREAVKVAGFEIGSVEWWLRAALECNGFNWDIDQHTCALLTLADRIPKA